MGDNMLQAALFVLEKAINQTLSTDLQTIARLQEMHGKKIKCEITDWHMIFFIMPQHHGVELQAHISGTADTTITGKLNDLVNVGLASQKAAAMRTYPIQFSGDVHTGIAMQQLLSHIDIDWEEHLARLVGDAPATLISRGLNAACQLGKSMKESLQRNVEEYIHHEAKLCPTPQELESFYDAIMTLRHDVDRLEARIQLLKRAKSDHSCS